VRVIYATSAQEDLAAIDAWISQDDPDRAISFVRELQDAADDLINGPSRFPPVDTERYPGIHRRNHGSYRILYRVTADEILILHVRHGRRDLPDL
jgi:toxin ParE1/3/4